LIANYFYKCFHTIENEEDFKIETKIDAKAKLKDDIMKINKNKRWNCGNGTVKERVTIEMIDKPLMSFIKQVLIQELNKEKITLKYTMWNFYRNLNSFIHGVVLFEHHFIWQPLQQLKFYKENKWLAQKPKQ